MKTVLHENVNIRRGASLKLFSTEADRLDVPYHRHEEFELALILKGSGRRIAGDSITPFFAGDISLFGPGLAHSYVSAPDSCGVKTLVVQFKSPEFARLAPEFAAVIRILEEADSGIGFSKRMFESARRAVTRMLRLPDFERLTELLKLLNTLARDPFCKRFSSGFARGADVRVDRGRDFLKNNFATEVSIAAAARKAGLSEGSFRRLFKAEYGLSPKKFLLDLRISCACRLLADTRTGILQISEECGFCNLSNFNRRFKSALKCTPAGFRKINLL